MTEVSDIPGGPDQAARLRDQAVGALIANGTITSKGVEAAMRTVPRDVFIPEAEPELAYDPFRAVVTKRDPEGNSLSSVSDMHVQAWMLEQAGIEPGMNVLEIGSGGYNAALIHELTGPAGQVTTVDIDDWVTGRAARFLAGTGHSQVNVVLADAEHGVPEHAPYDRILVTVGAWDVPPAWIDELAPDGRLVTALRLLGLNRTIAFKKSGGYLASTASKMFGFVAVQGAGSHRAKLLVMRRGEITLSCDDEIPGDPALLDGVFETPRVEVWSGALIGIYELLDTVQASLATAMPGFCTIMVDPGLDTGVVTPPPKRSFAMAAVDGPNLAYITTRRTTENGEKAAEFGVHAYGPGAAALAGEIAGHLRTWAAAHRLSHPEYRIYPAATPDDMLPERSRVIDKVHSRITISWPETATDNSGQDNPIPSPS